MWNRRLWMRLGAVSAALGAFALWYAHHIGGAAGDLVRIGAQIQFMHAMASVACATFMNIGAVRARFAPGFLLGGSILFALAQYSAAMGHDVGTLPAVAGGVLMLCGWGVIIVAGADIDRG
jgi:uncharacterized membrane protein YgdD (TMEM256/DUF423 family)